MTTPDERLDAAIGAAGRPPDAAALDSLAVAARAALGREPRARAWWVDGVIVLALTALLGVAGVLGMSWSEQQHGSQATKLVVAAAWALLMASGSVLWLKPGRASSRALVIGGFGSAALLTLLGASGVAGDVPFSSGLACAVTEVVMSLAPVVAVLVVSTRFAATSLHVVAGALAASSGAALALHFHCPNGTTAHLVTWHLLPALVVAALAALLRTRLRSRTFAP